MIKTAVIMAAGRGERLKPLTNTCPKALIKIGKKTLIEYSLNNLKKVGISKAIIITGHLENLIKEKLGDSYQGINISYVSNKEYSTTGSMYSLSLAEELINEDILLLESDLLYEFKALESLLDSSEPDLILTAPISGSGDEVFIIIDRLGKLIDLGKNIKDKDKSYGELVGITKLSVSFSKEMFKIAKDDYDQGKKKHHYEDVIYKTSKSCSVKCLREDDLSWIEIDKEDDLKRAKEVIFPKICESLLKSS